MKLNLPGSEGYDLTMPWMYKWNSKHKHMPAFFGTYVDDVRTGAWSETSCRSATCTVTSVVNYFGQQDAAHKRRLSSKVPGAWAGPMCISVDGMGLFVLSTQSKWEKAKGIIEKWAEELGNDARVDDDGWKIMSKTALVELASEDRSKDDDRVVVTESSASRTYHGRKKYQSDGDPPNKVQTVGHFKFDVEAMSTLLKGNTPSLRLIRVKIFRFGIRYVCGFFNLCKATNDVASLESMGEQGLLDVVEVFFLTDNSTAEAVFYNVNSKNEALFWLVLWLHKLEMIYSCKIHFIHCSGKRMIAQGTDSLSRGNLTAGVMAGKTMTSFISIHLNAFQRCELLKPWLQTWLGKESEFLDPIEWSVRGHFIVKGKFKIIMDGMKAPVVKNGSFVWCPPPCLAEIAVEELRKARHKRTGSCHFFVVPRLMQSTYFKQLLKAADLVFSLPVGHPAFVFPFLQY